MKTLAGLLLGLVLLTTACTSTGVPQQTPPATSSSLPAVQTPEQLLAGAEAADAEARGWADASGECKEFVAQYNKMVENGAIARPLIVLGETPNGQARISGSGKYYPIACEGPK